MSPGGTTTVCGCLHLVRLRLPAPMTPQIRACAMTIRTAVLTAFRSPASAASQTALSILSRRSACTKRRPSTLEPAGQRAPSARSGARCRGLVAELVRYRLIGHAGSDQLTSAGSALSGSDTAWGLAAATDQAEIGGGQLRGRSEGGAPAGRPARAVRVERGPRPGQRPLRSPQPLDQRNARTLWSSPCHLRRLDLSSQMTGRPLTMPGSREPALTTSTLKFG